jgi:2-polyprenyl-3-methyl-5-hydroxy-6-metoxy-1,4-benzoquinol methylase
MTLKINNNLFHELCPICGSISITNAYNLMYEGKLSYSSTQIEIQKKPELWKCNECKSFFTQNAINEEDSISLYKNSDAGKRWDAKKFEDEKTPYCVNVFKKFIRKDIEVLDIGCNTGEFLDFAKNNGASTYGFEYSIKSIEICESKGHTMLENLEVENKKFDVITAFDLVEHLYHPNTFFDKVIKLLKPNGKLIIFTGDIDCWAFKNCKGRWWYLNYPEHVIFISKNFYENKLHGLKLKNIYYTFNNRYFKNLNFTMAAIFNYSKMLGLRKGLKPYEGLPSPTPDHIIAVLSKT